TGFANAQCERIVKMPSGGTLTPEPRYGDPCRALYIYRSEYSDASSTNAGYVEHMSSLRWAEFFKVVAIAFMVLLIAVSLLYGVGQMVAWVRRGGARLLFGVGAAICA